MAREKAGYADYGRHNVYFRYDSRIRGDRCYRQACRRKYRCKQRNGCAGGGALYEVLQRHYLCSGRSAHRLCRRLYKGRQKAQPRSDREAENPAANIRYSGLSHLALYEHGQQALYVHPVRRECSDGHILLDFRLCRYLCRDKCGQLYRRHRRTLLERHGDLRHLNVYYRLYA